MVELHVVAVATQVRFLGGALILHYYTQIYANCHNCHFSRLSDCHTHVPLDEMILSKILKHMHRTWLEDACAVRNRYNIFNLMSTRTLKFPVQTRASCSKRAFTHFQLHSVFTGSIKFVKPRTHARPQTMDTWYCDQHTWKHYSICSLDGSKHASYKLISIPFMCSPV